jgi:hypothetical protein
MAARNGTHQQFTMNRNEWSLTAKATGAAGASPTGLKGVGIASLAWVSTGIYDLTLSDKYAALLGATFNVIDSTGARHYCITIKTETVSTTKIIRFTVFAAATAVAPTLADLVSTDILMIQLKLSNTLQTPNGN